MVRLLYRRSSTDAGVFAAVDRENSTVGLRYGGLTIQITALSLGKANHFFQNFLAAFTESARH